MSLVWQLNQKNIETHNNVESGFTFKKPFTLLLASQIMCLGTFYYLIF